MVPKEYFGVAITDYYYQWCYLKNSEFKTGNCQSWTIEKLFQKLIMNLIPNYHVHGSIGNYLQELIGFEVLARMNNTAE